MNHLCNVVATFGSGAFGRLGHGLSCSSQVFPRLVGPLVGYNAKQVACGGAHTAVVTDDGCLFTFGDNSKGQLGHSEKDKFVPVPLEVVLPDPVEHVAAGEGHTLALTRGGEVWAWGDHASGQLGIGHTPEEVHRIPRLVKELSGAKVQQLAAGVGHSMALAQGGREVYAWGHGTHGALGLGTTGVRGAQWSPMRLKGPLDGAQLVQLVAGLHSSGAVDAAAHVWTWGSGQWWQLGHGRDVHELVPRQVKGLNNVAQLAMAHQSSWALTRDGRALCWGTDENGSLAQGEGHWQRIPVKTPQANRFLPRCQSLAAGWKHALAVSTDGGLLSWGWNGAYGMGEFGFDAGGGQLGVGDGQDHWAPVRVQRLHTSSHRFYDLRTSYIKPWKVLQASCGRNHSAVVVQVDLDTRDVGE